jgi:tetratricopeptide (TPR) repeat protein
VGFERAVRLEPANASNWYLLGRYWQNNMEQPDLRQAISDYRTSLYLDPHSTDAWLDLATAYDEQGDSTQARDAFLAAKRSYPLSPKVCWRYGNFLLRQGELNAAFEQIHRAVEIDPELGTEAFSRCWRVDPDLNLILDKVLVPSEETYAGIIRELSEAGQIDSALKVWSRLFALHPTMSPKQISSLTIALQQDGRFQDLATVWGQAASLMSNPPLDPPGSIIWDGGFESDIVGDGLAWQFQPLDHGVVTGFDSEHAHTGRQSLRLMFTNEDNFDYSGPCHLAIPEPGKTYRFSAWVETQALTSNEGIRFQLRADGPSGAQVLQTADVHGSEPWKQVTLDWTQPPKAPFLRVCIVRRISGEPDGDIQGTAWVDDVSLVPIPPAGNDP